MEIGMIIFLSLVGVLILSLLTFLLICIQENIYSDLYRIKEKHGKLKKRLVHDDSVDVEETMRTIRHWETEFNIEKPDYCFWIKLRK